MLPYYQRSHCPGAGRTVRGHWPGVVSVLNAGTGAVLRSVPVGNNPTWMAGDEWTGRLFVVMLGIGLANGLTVRTLDTTSGAVLHSVTLLRSSTAGGSVWLGPDA